MQHSITSDSLIAEKKLNDGRQLHFSPAPFNSNGGTFPCSTTTWTWALNYQSHHRRMRHWEELKWEAKVGFQPSTSLGSSHTAIKSDRWSWGMSLNCELLPSKQASRQSIAILSWVSCAFQHWALRVPRSIRRQTQPLLRPHSFKVLHQFLPNVCKVTRDTSEWCHYPGKPSNVFRQV